MKKILLFATILFVAAACSQVETTITPTEPSSGEIVSFSIIASIATQSESRVSVTPGEEVWKVAWEANDELILINNESHEVITLAIESIDEQSGDATFSATATKGNYAVYVADNYSVTTDGTLVVDYSNQGDDANTPPMQMADLLEISGDDSEIEISLKHLAQVLDIRVSTTDLPTTDTYTLHSVTIKGDGYDFDDIRITTNTTLAADGSTQSLYCYAPAFDVESGSSIVIEAIIYGSSSGIYFEQTTTTNNTDSTLSFEAGKHNYLTAKFSASDLTADLWSDYAADNFVGGDGSEDNPYQIATAEQLTKLSTDVAAGEAYSDTYFELIADIDLNGREWVAIGTSSSFCFSGTFNGAGHTIANLRINKPSTDYQGLFGYLKSATIKYIGIVSGAVSGKSCVGGVTGYNTSSSAITSCYNLCSVSCSEDHVAGVAGYNTSSSTISSCYNRGSVSGNTRVGGIVGYNYLSSTVTSCYSSGSVSGSSYVGGVIGRSTSSYVSSCYFDKELFAGSAIGLTAGGSITNAEGMETDAMQAAEFVATLNVASNSYNAGAGTKPQASGWVAVVADYPTIDFDSTPNEDGTITK